MEEELAGLNIERGEEEDAVSLPMDLVLHQSAYEHCFVGCFLTASIVHFKAMKNKMANLWHLLRGVQISDLGVKRFLFKFFNEIDLDRVVQDSP